MSDSETRARKTLDKEADEIDREDLDRVLTRRETIERKIRNSPRLSGYLDRLQTLYSLIQDYVNGNYREIPWASIASLAAALLYVLNPMDMIPDFLPFFGFVDDATVLGLCLKLIGKDLVRYEEWRQQHEKERH